MRLRSTSGFDPNGPDGTAADRARGTLRILKPVRMKAIDLQQRMQLDRQGASRAGGRTAPTKRGGLPGTPAASEPD